MGEGGRGYRSLESGPLLDLVEDGDSVRAGSEPGDREHDYLLELTQVVPSRHTLFHKCEDSDEKPFAPWVERVSAETDYSGTAIQMSTARTTS